MPFFQIALGNILKFRKKNWQFDFIGGFIYFILVFSMFPQVIFLTKYLDLKDSEIILFLFYKLIKFYSQ